MAHKILVNIGKNVSGITKNVSIYNMREENFSATHTHTQCLKRATKRKQGDISYCQKSPSLKENSSISAFKLINSVSI